MASLNVHLWCNFTVTSANQTALYSAFVWLCPIYSDTWCLNCASVLGKEMFFCVFRFVIHSDGLCWKLGFNGRRYALLPTFYKQDLYWFSFYHLTKKVPKWFLISFYYAAGSVSGRNEGQLSVDWLPERAWWPILSTRDYLRFLLISWRKSFSLAWLSAFTKSFAETRKDFAEYWMKLLFERGGPNAHS